MSELKVLHLDSNHPVLLQQLQQAGFENHEDYVSEKAQIEARIHQYQGIVIRSRFSLDRSFLEKAVNLKFIARVGAGLENIDCAFAESRGIALIAAPEGNRNAVAEHTLGMLLSLFNKLNFVDRQVRQGVWIREENRGVELDGKTVGIIGYGNMGKAFAKKLRGFDCEVICHDILPDVSDYNARQVPLEELQAKADVVSLHLPWTPQTDKMVDAGFLSAFAKPIWLLNTSRGKNVVTDDLVSALKSGKVLGAGLDVLEYEKSSFESLFSQQKPPALEYLLQAENVMLSPHIAGWTQESKKRLAEVIVEKIKTLYFGESQRAEPKKVTGIGGFFFKSSSPETLKEWYREHLGLDTNQWGCTFNWKDDQGNDCTTQWSVFKEDTDYLNPSEKPFMQNFRVENLDYLIGKLKTSGVEVIGEIQRFEYGNFGWILDPEGNKIELWEPKDYAF